jgi:hypothetical protein
MKHPVNTRLELKLDDEVEDMKYRLHSYVLKGKGKADLFEL